MTGDTIIRWRCPRCGESGSVEVRPLRHGEARETYTREIVGRAVLHQHRLRNLLCEGQVAFRGTGRRSGKRR